MQTSSTNNITKLKVSRNYWLKFENCNCMKKKEFMSDFFCDPLEDKIVYIIQSRMSFCASPSCRPQLRLGLQSLGLPQKDSLLLFMI
jgi:hypothetical protein